MAKLEYTFTFTTEQINRLAVQALKEMLRWPEWKLDSWNTSREEIRAKLVELELELEA